MYRTGHYGAALIVYAPLGLLLLLAGRPMLAVGGGALSLSLASLPDVDQRLPFVDHRGVTHTVGFALVVGSVLGVAGWFVAAESGVGTAGELATLAAAVGTVAIGSHLLADAITPMGITPWWPLSTRHYTADLCRADNTLANYALLGMGVLLTVLVLAVAPR